MEALELAALFIVALMLLHGRHTLLRDWTIDLLDLPKCMAPGV